MFQLCLFITGLFNYPLNEAACPSVIMVYSPIKAGEDIYTPYARSLTRLSVLNEKKNIMLRGIDTVSRVEKLQAEHGLSCGK